MENKILITGASGFVGTHLIGYLSNLGYKLDALSKSAQSIKGIQQVYNWKEITSIDGPYDCVIHLAGLAHDTSKTADTSAYYEVNVGLTETLLSQIEKWKVKKFIYLSSIKAMVDSFSSEIIDEESKCIPTHVYGLSKLKAEENILKNASKAKKYIFRPVLIYGPGQKGNLQLLEKLIAWHIPIPLKSWKNQRSLLYIENLNFIIHQCIEKDIVTGTYLVADDAPISTYTIIDNIAKGQRKRIIGFGFPNSFYRLLLKIAPNKIKLVLNKILGSLAVDNTKIKAALQINAMPFTTQEGFVATYRTEQD